MLPRPLCENLCSLNPGADRLTYTVEWTLNPDGQILSEWFGRTVIRSCVKLAYEHAQSMIDDPSKMEWSEGEIPGISFMYRETNGNYEFWSLIFKSFTKIYQKVAESVAVFSTTILSLLWQQFSTFSILSKNRTKTYFFYL